LKDLLNEWQWVESVSKHYSFENNSWEQTKKCF
jgi:hypothetical protein